MASYCRLIMASGDATSLDPSVEYEYRPRPPQNPNYRKRPGRVWRRCGFVFADRKRHCTHQVEDLRGPNFEDRHVRGKFRDKVGLIGLVQAVVLAVYIMCLQMPSDTPLLLTLSGQRTYYISFTFFTVTYTLITTCPNVRRTWPVNFFTLAIFTCSFSCMTAFIACSYKFSTVLKALHLNSLTFILVQFVATSRKVDLTDRLWLLGFTSAVLLLGSLLMLLIYVWIEMSNATLRVLQSSFGAVGVFLFAMFVFCDTQLIDGGRKNELSEEEYISGAMYFFIDTSNMFVFYLCTIGFYTD